MVLPVKLETALLVRCAADKKARGTAKTTLNSVVFLRGACRTPPALWFFSILDDAHEFTLPSSDMLVSDIEK
jgi:hypothetical protein